MDFACTIMDQSWYLRWPAGQGSPTVDRDQEKELFIPSLLCLSVLHFISKPFWSILERVSVMTLLWKEPKRPRTIIVIFYISPHIKARTCALHMYASTPEDHSMTETRCTKWRSKNPSQFILMQVLISDWFKMNNPGQMLNHTRHQENRQNQDVPW